MSVFEKKEVREVLPKLTEVLTRMRPKPLKGQALEDMKTVEQAVQLLEVLNLW